MESGGHSVFSQSHRIDGAVDREIEEKIEIYPKNDDLTISVVPVENEKAISKGKFVSVPGVKANSSDAFLPFALAISFFSFDVQWCRTAK